MSDIPVSPPPEALDAIAFAAGCVDELAARGLELHFETDPVYGHATIELRTLDGTLVRRVKPSEVLDIASGLGPL